jgi:adenylate kinase
LVWVLDQILGLLQRSARTGEQEEAVKELRSLALLPKPDKAKLQSLVHRLETMDSITPEPLRTNRPLKRAGVIESRPVRITLDRELNRLIESIGKKAGAKRTAGRKPARKLAPKKPARKIAPTKPTRKVAPKKAARKIAPKKPTRKAVPKKPTAKVAPRKPAVTIGGMKTAVRAGGGKKTAAK